MVSFEQVYLVAHITPAESREYGAKCQFIRINEQWGMKFYQTNYFRNKTHAFQAKAAKAGLAPRVGEYFELRLPFYDEDEPTEVFGYVTECISETYGDRKAYHKYGCEYEECSKNEQITIDEIMFNDYEYKQLIEGIEEIGITTNDIHALNVGFLRNRLVCIDFSDEYEL